MPALLMVSAESLKRRKYQNLICNYIFGPFGVETLDSWGCAMFKKLAKQLIDASRDQKADLF